MAGSKSLFACTKCHSRHPFDELSKEEHLCKACRRKYPLIPCVYCRLEYHILTKVHGEAVCSKCSHYLSLFGQPTNCKYCQIKAAFEKSCCARCSSSEKRYGAPVSCNRCKLCCAFNKSKESQSKVGGQILCLQCTLEYKRIRHKREKQMQNGEKYSYPEKWKSSKSDPVVASLKAENLSTKFKSGYNRSGSPFISTTSQDSEASHEFAYGDQMSEMTKLRDEIAVLKKTISQKDNVIFEKDKKINEVNADQWEREKQFRTKLNRIQKEADEKILDLQEENRSLKKQISTLSRNPKAKRTERLQSKIRIEPHMLSSSPVPPVLFVTKQEVKSLTPDYVKEDYDVELPEIKLDYNTLNTDKENCDAVTKAKQNEEEFTDQNNDKLTMVKQEEDKLAKTKQEEDKLKLKGNQDDVKFSRDNQNHDKLTKVKQDDGKFIKNQQDEDRLTKVNHGDDDEVNDFPLNQLATQKKIKKNVISDFSIIVRKENVVKKKEIVTEDSDSNSEDACNKKEGGKNKEQVNNVADTFKQDGDNTLYQSTEEEKHELVIHRTFDKVQKEEIQKIMSDNSAVKSHKPKKKKKRKHKSVKTIDEEMNDSSGADIKEDEPLRKRKRKKQKNFLDDEEEDKDHLKIGFNQFNKDKKEAINSGEDMVKSVSASPRSHSPVAENNVYESRINEFSFSPASPNSLDVVSRDVSDNAESNADSNDPLADNCPDTPKLEININSPGGLSLSDESDSDD